MLSLQLLGAPQIALDNFAVTVGHQKAVGLLTYLAVTDRPHTRDALAALLWPDNEPSRARSELRRMLWALNKALGKGWLNSDRQAVSLAERPDLQVDVRRFRTLLERPQGHRHAPAELCAACLHARKAAADLYQDEFLAGFSLSDSEPFEQWQLQEAYQLRQAAALNLDRLIHYHLPRASQEMDALVSLAQKRLTLDVAHEPTHRLLMAYYAISDQAAAVQQQFQFCVQALEEEVATKPSLATTRLYDRIRSGETLGWSDLARAFDPDWEPAEVPEATEPAPPARSSPVPSTPETPHNLPAPITEFVGRKAETATLVGLLQDPGVRFVSIVAPGGMGKTSLALEVGRRLLGQFHNGVFFVELAPLNDRRNMMSVIAEAMGYQFQAGSRDQTQQILDYLANKEMLLLLDNFEHLLDGASLVVDILSAAPRVKILTTSRQRLNQTGETLFTLGGMGLPGWNAPKDIHNYESIALFQQSARRTEPGFKLTADSLQSVIKICRLVDGMPLGILLAASWLPVLSPAEIAAEIRQGLDIFDVDAGEVLERQRSIRVIFDSAWQLMKAPEQQLFMNLSVFRGGFTRAAAVAIAGGNLRSLQALISKSMLSRAADSGRYHVHELLRQYAAEKLRESGQLGDVTARHTRFYLEELAEQTALLKGSGQSMALKRIEADFENIRAAWLNAVENRESPLLDQALEALYLFCYLQSRLEEGKTLFEHARVSLAPAAADEPAPVWHRLGVRFYSGHDDPTFLKDRLEQARRIAQEREDWAEVAFCLHTSATIAHYVDQDAAAAIQFYEACADIYRRLDDKYYLGHTLSKLGEAYQLIGRTDLTVQLVNEAYDLQREIGDQSGTSETLRAMAMTAYQRGRYRDALGYMEQSYTLQRETNFVVGQASSDLYIGMMIFFRGDVNQGRKQVTEGLQLALDVVDYSTQAWCYAVLSMFDSWAGDYEAAAENVARAESIETDPFRQTGAGNPFLELHINLANACLYFGRGEIGIGSNHLLPAARLAYQTESRPYLTFFSAFMAMLHADAGRYEQAARTLGVAMAQPKEINGWMVQWVALKALRRTLRQQLGDADFQANCEVGKQLDLLSVTGTSLRELEALCQRLAADHAEKPGDDTSR